MYSGIRAGSVTALTNRMTEVMCQFLDLGLKTLSATTFDVLEYILLEL